jgi:hypothetical protein
MLLLLLASKIYSKTLTIADDLNKVKDGEMDTEKICLGCRSSNKEIVGQHPYFEGSLCKNCMVRDILVSAWIHANLIL